MAEKKIRLHIITPEQSKIDEDVDMVIMRCTTGDMGIMPGHETRSAVLDYGVMRILNDDNERWIAVYGGLAVIKDNVLTVLTHDAEWPEEIDRAHAHVTREHAERRLQEKTDDLEIQSDQVLLRRALVQIEVSSYTFKDDDNDDE